MGAAPADGFFDRLAAGAEGGAHLSAEAYLDAAEDVLCQHVDDRAEEWRRSTGDEPGIDDLQDFADELADEDVASYVGA